MNSFSPGFYPTINNSVYLVGTAADAARGGGPASNYYSTFQEAYDKANSMQVILGGSNVVTLFVLQTTAAQVGNLTLTANYNRFIKIAGESIYSSEIGTIISSNASGNSFTVGNGTTQATYFSSVKVAGITTSSTGTTGNSGSVSISSFCCDFGPINTKPSNAGNITGTGGAVVIADNTNFAGLIQPSNFNDVTIGSNAAVSAGILIINAKLSTFRNLNLATGTSTMSTTNIDCYCINTIVLTTSAIVTINVTVSKYIGSAIGVLSNGSNAVFTNTNFGGVVLNTAGDGSTQCTYTFNNCTFTNNIVFTNNLPKGVFNNCGFVNSTSSGCSVGVGNNSMFKNCYNTVNSSPPTGLFTNLGTGVEFYNCNFIASTFWIGMVTGTSTVTVKNCFFGASSVGTGITILGQRDFLSTVATTDDTPTTIFTFPIPTGQAAKIIAEVTAVSVNNRMAVLKCNIIKNIAGTLSKVAATDVDLISAPVSDVALAAATINITFSGTNAIVQVTGIVATSISWFANIKLTTQ